MKATVLRISLLTALLSALLVSCFEDEKKPVETMYTGFMTAKTNSDGYVKTMKNDFGTTYTIDGKSEQLKPDTAYRVVASLALTESMARIVEMVPTISHKAPIDHDIPDSVKVQDPIEIVSLYIGGGYLNVYLGIKVKNEDSKHMLLYSRLDSQDKVEFTFYHNAYGDGEVYTKHAYVSIPLQSYGLAQNDTVFLSCKGYTEDYDYELIYK